MWSDYFLNLTFWVVVLLVLTIIFGTTYCIFNCCRPADYPGKIIEYPEANTDCQHSPPYSPPQHTAATYYPSVPGAVSSCVNGPYVAMTPCVNISDAHRTASSVDPASLPPPSYAQVMRASQIYYSLQEPAGLPGQYGPPGPHGSTVLPGPNGLPVPSGPHGPPYYMAQLTNNNTQPC